MKSETNYKKGKQKRDSAHPLEDVHLDVFRTPIPVIEDQKKMVNIGRKEEEKKRNNKKNKR